MSKSITKPVPWSFAEIWNGVTHEEQRPLVKRNHLWASELGQPFIDRYLRMRAVPYSNPPNKRSLNKFLAGRIWEHVVKQILITAGIYKREEVKVDAKPYKDCLEIHGKLDFLAGGYVDRDTALANINLLHLPEFLHDRAEKIINAIAGANLEKKILELKAISAYAMELISKRRCAVPSNTLQAYHYQKNGKIKAEICYISKDSSLMAQFGIDAKAAEKLYKADVEQMTYYINKKKMPPKEPLAKFDTLLGQFSKNLGVEWSPYLTSVYSIANPEEYRQQVKFIAQWNRAVARFAANANGGLTPTGMKITITEKNLAVKAAIIKAGFNFDEVLRCKLAAGVTDEEIDV